MLNKIVLMGRLTRDPELRRTQSGISVAAFPIAVDRDYADKSTGQKTTDFIDIVAWRTTAEFVSKYFSKGRMAVVIGSLQMRDWEDRNGDKRRSAEVVADSVYFGDSKRDGDTQRSYQQQGGYQSSYRQQGASQQGYQNSPPPAYSQAPDAPYPQESINGYTRAPVPHQDYEDDDGDLPF